MYGIIVKNIGMRGCTSWCTRDGQPELYETRAEAEKVALEYNNRQSPVNRFNEYFAEEYLARKG